MKVIKDGKRNCGAFKFKCNKCGCKFEADMSDYLYVTRDKDNWVYCPTENNTPSDAVRCECPNCGKKIVKEIYKRRSNVENQKSYGFVVSAIFSFTLAMFILIVFPPQTKAPIELQMIIEVAAFIYLAVNALVNLTVYNDY